MNKTYLFLLGVIIAALWLTTPNQTLAAPSNDPPAPPIDSIICKVVNDIRTNQAIHEAKSSGNIYRIPDPFGNFAKYHQMIASTAERLSLTQEEVASAIQTLVYHEGFGINLVHSEIFVGMQFVLFYDDIGRCPPPPPGASASSGANELQTQEVHDFDTKLMIVLMLVLIVVTICGSVTVITLQGKKASLPA